ncbi:M15 family metallopeptidase [Nocardia sp. NPDC060259]|uniref:M15 family metallopeptidase n=1 Tax=Nocardia sp. NPDC060259 TaxID=3347088 RepID=UPI00364CC02B
MSGRSESAVCASQGSDEADPAGWPTREDLFVDSVREAESGWAEADDSESDRYARADEQLSDPAFESDTRFESDYGAEADPEVEPGYGPETSEHGLDTEDADRATDSFVDEAEFAEELDESGWEKEHSVDEVERDGAEYDEYDSMEIPVEFGHDSYAEDDTPDTDRTGSDLEEPADFHDARETCECENCAHCAEQADSSAEAFEAPVVPANTRPPIRSTSTLREAWREYRCATARMVSLRMFGNWNTPVNPRTVEAWRALESSLTSAGYEVHRAWVYVCRNIGGTASASLHAYGLAIDIDHSRPTCNVNRPTPNRRQVWFSSAATKPDRCLDVRRGTADTSFTPEQVAAVEAIRTVDGFQVFAWGGRWSTTKDTMHFQINVTPTELARGIAPESIGTVQASEASDEYGAEQWPQPEDEPAAFDRLSSGGYLDSELIDADEADAELQGHEDEPMRLADEAMDSEGERQLTIPSTRPVATAADLDTALRVAFTTTGVAIVARSGCGYAVHQIGTPAICVPEPLVWNVLTVTEIHAVVLNGRTAYLPDPAGVGRWVQLPRMKEFFALPGATQGRQRARWIAALRKPGSTLPPIDLNRADSALLRALLVWNAQHAHPVDTVHRRIGGVPRDRGGRVNGATAPIAPIPLSEPDCYLPVIFTVEGGLESINAWDAGAGLSLGPIQINAQRAALPRFLWAVWQEDPALFTRVLGADTLGWQMRVHGDHPDLIATRGTSVVTMHGSDTDADVRRMIRYLHNGDPGKEGFDPAWRRRPAAAMLALVCWPHIQELLLRASSDWLRPGLAAINRAGIGPVDPVRPDQDTFVLTALLLSAYVRFSSCLPKLLKLLVKWPSAGAKLEHLQGAVESLGDPCRELIPRLSAQKTSARNVFRELPVTARSTPGDATIRGATTSEEAWGTVGTIPGGPAGGLAGRRMGAWADRPSAVVAPPAITTPSRTPPASSARPEGRAGGAIATEKECVAVPVLVPPTLACPAMDGVSADRPLRMPSPRAGRFESDPAIAAFATDLGRCYATRKGGSDDERARITTWMADDLASDYAASLAAGLVRYGEAWRKRADTAVQQRAEELRRTRRGVLTTDDLAIVERERCVQELWLAGRMNWLRTGWMVGQREKIDFSTLMPPSIPMLRSFAPPALPPGTEPSLVPIEPEGRGTPITSEAKRFLVELRGRSSGFDAANYSGHGGGKFSGRGLSLDLRLRSPLDSRGFYPRDKAIAFLADIDAAARAVGLRWRVLYNDFAVAAHVNRLKGARHVGFVGSPSRNLNWHGPLVLHFHLDLAP